MNSSGATRSPGEPLNPLNMPHNQGIGFIYAPGYYGVANPNYPKGFRLPPTVIAVETVKYTSHDVSFQPMTTEHKS